MAESILQTYLNEQFIKTTEEGNVTNLKKVVVELVRNLRKKKTKIIAYTLVSIDPQISEDDPVVLEVEKIIIKKWPAFKNNVTATKDKATTYIRAVILEALNKLALEDEFAAIIWLTSKNLVKYYKIGNEIEVISTLFQVFANETEKKGQNLWSLSKQVELPTISIPEISITTKIVSKDYLVKRLSAAAGPSRVIDGANTANEDPKNKHWANGNQNWVADFGDIAGHAISNSVNKVLKDQNSTLSGITEQVNTSLQGLNPYFNEIGKIFLQSSEALSKRSQLIWWKETLYSPALGKTYRELSPIFTAIVMAVDLTDMVSPIYPQSVDFLLKETLKSVHGEEVDKEYSFIDLVNKITKMNEAEKSLLKKFARNQNGRKTLGAAISNKLVEESSDLFAETGIENEAKVKLSDFSVWLFNDLQAAKLATA